MNFIRQLTGSPKAKKKEDWRARLAGGDRSTDNLACDQQDPLKMLVMSVDTLRNIEIDQTIKSGWRDSPPLYESQKGDDDAHPLKIMCREGIPVALRSAVWITSIVRVARPYQSVAETEEYGTLGKIKVLDHGWECTKQSLFSDQSDEDAVTIPDFGTDPIEVEAQLVQDHLMVGGNLCATGVKGVKSLTLVLYAAKENLGIEYCPLLPDLTALLLSAMPESYAYACIREMKNSGDHYFPLSEMEYISWCKTFGDIMRRMYTKTANAMARIGALSHEDIEPIFRRFFVTILKREHVLRIVDIYTIEGYKIVFRFASLLLCFCHAYMTPEEFETKEKFWDGVKRVSHSDDFIFDVLLKQSYGFNGKKYRSRRSFPRRKFIRKVMNYNEVWAEKFCTNRVISISEKPLGYVQGNIPILLAKKASERLSLAEFLPLAYKSTKLELIYSSDVDGRSLDMFYKKCSRAKHTITLIEVLNSDAVIGMFATETWHKSNKVYGDGNCVLFRLKPNPICFHWSPIGGINSEDNNNDSIETEAIFKHFMVSKDNFLSMGSNESGSSGLRLNADLSRGSSAKARGFDNDPLAGSDMADFDVGLVEVYHLLREMDGKAIDKEEDIWKGMFD